MQTVVSVNDLCSEHYYSLMLNLYVLQIFVNGFDKRAHFTQNAKI